MGYKFENFARIFILWPSFACMGGFLVGIRRALYGFIFIYVFEVVKFKSDINFNKK